MARKEYSKDEVDELITSLEHEAAARDLGAADGDQTAKDATRPDHVRDFARRAAATHRAAARELRQSARALRDGTHPDDL